jgi:hypothetical protein
MHKFWWGNLLGNITWKVENETVGMSLKERGCEDGRCMELGKVGFGISGAELVNAGTAVSIYVLLVAELT